MSEGLSIPQIAITPELNDWNSSTNNIGDTLTDVEDLEDTTTKKFKSKLKIKIRDNGGTTDVEDLEGSDLENDTKLQCVSFDDLHLDNCNFEENNAGASGNFSQSYNTKGHDLLSLLPDEGGVTDVESVATDNEPDSDEIPDIDINFEGYEPENVNISNDLKQSLELPNFEPNVLTDVESVPSDREEKCLLKKVRTKKRKTRNCGKGGNVHCTDAFKYWSGMKKSSSQPISLNQQQAWSGFDSDGDIEEEKVPKFPFCHQNNRGVKKVDAALLGSRDSIATETDVESLDEDQREWDVLEIILPPPVRTVVYLSENKALVPTTNILPLDETEYLNVESDHDGGTTDLEYFPDDDNLLTAETYERGPTPEVFHYENSNTMYGENQLNLPNDNADPVTDTEDLVTEARPRRVKKIKNKTLNVVATNESALTDTEDFYLSDSNKSPLKRQYVVGSMDEHFLIPSYMKQVNNTTVSSKDSEGVSSSKNLNVTKPKVFASPNLTDVEDIVASADEDNYSEPEASNGFAKLESSRVHIESTKKLDLNSPHEVMYLKGGAYIQHHTDVEDISDDEPACLEPEKDWDVSKKSAPQEEAPVPQDAEQQGEESGFAATGGQDSAVKAEGEESATSGQQTDGTSSQQRSVADQHQLSEEMKQLLKELEKESKEQ